MPSCILRIVATTGILIFSLWNARSASAQCSAVTFQFGNVSLQTGNPFQGEYSSSMAPPLANTNMTLPAGPSLRFLARDSQGRVREQRFAGKYKVKTADGAETEQEQHLITICDAASQKLIRLDTLNKTATVSGPRTGLQRPSLPFQRTPQPFCATYFKRFKAMRTMQWEDLGTQLISGVDAQGLRTWIAADDGVSGSPTSPSPAIQITGAQKSWVPL